MIYGGAKMASENDSYDEFNDSLYDEDDEILPDEEKMEAQDKDRLKAKSSNLATWRKIEDFWDNYKLNKQINDNPLDDNFDDYFADGELN